MVISVNKQLHIKISDNLYTKVKRICDREYKSMSVLIKELLLEKIEDSLTPKQLIQLEKSRREFKQGKGSPWRAVKRG